jgi:phosphomannomutase
MDLIVSISGIRGVIGRTLTPEVAVRYAAGFAEYCARAVPGNPAVVLGGDGRRSGRMVSDIVAGTLAAKGMHVRSLGVCPTPTVQMAVEHEHAAGGIAVTASHNPMEWNGMKFIAQTGMFLDGGENREFWALAGESQAYADWQSAGTVADDTTWLRKHMDAVLGLSWIDPPSIRRRRFKVVLDCINAAGGAIVPALLDELGCTVVPLNCDVSGVFARTPEPVPENLGAVAARVRQEKADIGIVVDPDVDRLVLIDERGEPYGEEYTVATAVDFVLRRTTQAGKGPSGPGQQTVVVNLSTTRAVDDIAAAHGARCLRTPVGEINVARRMKEEGAVVGGEGSGGVILPAVHLGRDAIVGIGLILQALADSGTTVSGMKAALPQYQIAKGKIALGSVNAEEVMARLEQAYAGRAQVNREDGLRFDFDDHWIHLRKSNTEPIMRIIAEARSAGEANRAIDRVRQMIAR